MLRDASDKVGPCSPQANELFIDHAVPSDNTPMPIPDAIEQRAPEPSPTLGEELIVELGRRGMRGAYFDYRGYCELRCIDSADRLQAFFDARGFNRVSAADDLATIANGLERIESRRMLRSVPLWMEIVMHLAALVFG